MSRADVSFLVVGTPRSGTTLLQRLACELPGVGMPPETHFFDYVVPEWESVGRAEALRSWVQQPQLAQVPIDLGALRGQSPGQVFGEVVRQLSPESAVRGEKTPGHVAWWQPLARFDPELRFVAIVRDPRAVVVSNLASPWAAGLADASWATARDLAVAERWRQHQRDIQAMARAIPERTLVLRYEDLVAAPDRTRGRIAALLGVPAAVPAAVGSSDFVLPWEAWKMAALGPVATDRAEAWREELPPERAALIAALCARQMRAFGYPEVPPPGRAAVALARLPVQTIRSLRGLRQGLNRRREWISARVL